MADVLSFQPCGNRKFLLTEAFTSLYIYIYIYIYISSETYNQREGIISQEKGKRE